MRCKGLGDSRWWIPAIGLLVAVLATGCGSAQPTPTAEPAAITVEISPDSPTSSIKPTEPIEALSTPTAPQEVLLSPSFPLSEPGPYFAGNRVHAIVDDSRNGREIELLIWYPAEEHKDANGNAIIRDAVVDASGAPYPLILTSEETGRYLFRSHLAKHGFVLAVVRSPSSYDHPSSIIEGAQDYILALNQIASNPPAELAGVIDTDRVGVAGYSWDGGVSLAVSGARVDPEFYLSECEEPSPLISSFSTSWIEEICIPAENWDEYVSHIRTEITSSDDGLWQPITDDRILAVMPMTLDGAWLFGERGLMSVDRPTLMLCATKTPVQLENAYAFEHLGTPKRSMISWVERSDGMVFVPEVAGQMNHFVTAFFGYHLQGIEEYSRYISEDYVSQFDHLAWGFYTDE